MRRTVLTPFLFTLALFAAPVFAQTVEQDGAVDSYSLATARAEHIFIADQGAIEAERKCHDRTFPPGDLSALNDKIAAEMAAAAPAIALGGARLINLRQQAEGDIDSKIGREGCDGNTASDALEIFRRRLG